MINNLLNLTVDQSNQTAMLAEEKDAFIDLKYIFHQKAKSR